MDPLRAHRVQEAGPFLGCEDTRQVPYTVQPNRLVPRTRIDGAKEDAAGGGELTHRDLGADVAAPEQRRRLACMRGERTLERGAPAGRQAALHLPRARARRHRAPAAELHPKSQVPEQRVLVVRERGVEVATEAVVRAPVQVVRSQQRKSRWGRREDVQDSNDSGASVARRCLQVLGFRV